MNQDKNSTSNQIDTVIKPKYIRDENDVVVVSGLGKKYELYNRPRDRLFGLLGAAKKGQIHWALNNVSFALKPGQCLGLVGNNGAGKSTLLKLLAGTLRPSHGRVSVDGRLTAILELGAGFHPEFSGRDNIFFGGSLIGLDEKKITELLPSIVEFAELNYALNRPVKTYSSGMVVRLAFALITAVEPQVLIIDEALAVGDQNFQKKCVERIAEFKNNGCTIIFCSHSLYHIKQLCDVALWMHCGSAKAFGGTEEVLAQYEFFLRAELKNTRGEEIKQKESLAKDNNSSVEAPLRQRAAKKNDLARIVSVKVKHLSNDELPLLITSDLVVNVAAEAQEDEAPNFAVMLEQASGSGITTVATHTDGVKAQRDIDGLWKIVLTFPEIPLFSGDYVLSVYLFDSSGLVVYDEWLTCQYFKIIYPSVIPGLVRLPHMWS